MTTTDAKRKRTPSKRRTKSKRSRGRWLTAATSDPLVLYEQSVQDPAGEVEFIDQVWKERRKRRARTLREDFCGTAIVSQAWIRERPRNVAYAIDIDPRVLTWARARLAQRLKPAQIRRLHLIEGDVLKTKTPPVDTVIALNFSYFLFKTREALRMYFRTVHRNLVSDGIFICDAYGGSESFEEMKEERDCDGFTYIWDQHMYNPVTGEVLNHIHFRFPDKTELKQAFTYDWRLWTLPEIREVMAEAGFRQTTVYWEGTDESGEEGNGEFSPSEKGDACPGWVSYIVGEK